jgi:hypothetical protein
VATAAGSTVEGGATTGRTTREDGVVVAAERGETVDELEEEDSLDSGAGEDDVEGAIRNDFNGSFLRSIENPDS